MKIVFALIAHTASTLVSDLIRTMTCTGHRIVVHCDAKMPAADYDRLVQQVGGSDAVRFAKRVKVGWGEWSVVEATLNCLDTIEQSGWEPDYVYLMSGMDYPIRESLQLEEFLDRNRGDEFIESVPSEQVRWVKSGPQRERYQYRWYFNWRDNPHLTEHMFGLQRRLGIKRSFVRNMSPHLGSQWWVLTWATLKEIMRLAREPDIIAFFRTTLIPDELFFQTLVRQVVPDHRIIGCPLTLYQFSDYGYPVVYHADHVDYLVRQRFFMARKLSSHDVGLRKLLHPYWVGDKKAPVFDDEDVGIRGSEYEDWRLAHREGAPNQPLVGAAGLRWAASPRRTSKPHFVLIGTSTAELRFLHRVLARDPDLTMHGQLFHQTDIEFADGLESFASYGTKDVQTRDVSTLDFLADVVRADLRRNTGLLLRWGQGGQIADTLMERSNVRVVLLGGDPIVSFSENALGPHPLLVQPFRPEEFKRLPPSAAANRFRLFLKDYHAYIKHMEQRFAAATAQKPKGWMVRLDAGRVGPDWLKRLESGIGIKLKIAPGEFEAERIAAAEDLELRRRLATELLIAGGVDPVVFEVLRQEVGNPGVALSLV